MTKEAKVCCSPEHYCCGIECDVCDDCKCFDCKVSCLMCYIGYKESQNCKGGE